MMVHFHSTGGQKPEITPNKSQYIRIRATVVSNNCNVLIPYTAVGLTQALYISFITLLIPTASDKKSWISCFTNEKTGQSVKHFVQDYQTTSVRGKAQVKLFFTSVATHLFKLHNDHRRNTPSGKIVWKHIVNGDLGSTCRNRRPEYRTQVEWTELN